MDAKFQPSFIPKQPIMSTPQSVSSRISLLSVIAAVIFIVTIGLVGAVFITEHVLKGDITTLNQNLVGAKASFELSTIEELKHVSAKLRIAGSLLGRHIAISKILEALEKSTYENVAFSSFATKASDTGAVTISLVGTAGSYNSLLLQAQEFESVPFLKSPSFSNFTLGKNGDVAFTFNASVEPALVDYKKYITEQ